MEQVYVVVEETSSDLQESRNVYAFNSYDKANAAAMAMMQTFDEYGNNVISQQMLEDDETYQWYFARNVIGDGSDNEYICRSNNDARFYHIILVFTLEIK